MDRERRHDIDLHVAIEEYVKAVQSPTERRGDQRALLRRSGFREGDCGCGHWRCILPSKGLFHRGDAEARRKTEARLAADERRRTQIKDKGHYRICVPLRSSA